LGIGRGSASKGGNNKITVKGGILEGDRLTSTRSTQTGVDSVGLNEIVVYLPTITDQATLDMAAERILAALLKTRSSSSAAPNMSELTESITVDVKDTNPPGTFLPEDYVTVTSETLACSGLRKIKRIQRNLKSPQWARIDFTTRHLEQWELDENIRRTVRNLNTLV